MTATRKRTIHEATDEELDLIENASYGIDISSKYIQNPFDIPEAFKEEPHIFLTYMLSRPEYIAAFCKYVLNVQLLPYQAVIIQQMWKYKFPILIASRGGAKTFLLSLYAMLRSIFIQGRKIVVVGSAFRQSKFSYSYVENFYNNAPLLRSMFSGDSQGPHKDTDMWSFQFGDSRINFIPLGTGEKIRGLRAHDLLADEKKSINEQIFNEVCQGFTAVSSDPINNVMKNMARRKAEQLGIEFEPENRDNDWIKSNQTLQSGTAYFSFNHWYKTWGIHKMIIQSGGDFRKLKELIPDGEVPENVDPRDYCIIRIPYEMLPRDFMDDASVAKAKLSISNSIYLNEYGACFSADSDGFFRRTLIESCTSAPGRIIIGGKELETQPKLKGDKNKRYVLGIDPASERDNLAIVILELQSDGSRHVVYSWTTNKREYRDLLKTQGLNEHDYFTYINRKVRDLMGKFNIIRIMIDSQGGGYAVMEALRNKATLKEGELQIFTVKPEDPKDYEDEHMMEGIHIIEPVSFASSTWSGEANHGMKKDMEDKKLIFPYVDGVLLAIATEQADLDKDYDTVPDIMEDIEDLKDELCTITVTITPGGREHFCTPEEIVNGKKGRQKKDRYSSLLMANMGARQIQNSSPIEFSPSIGGFAGISKQKSTSLYYGNDDFAKAATAAYRIYD